MGLQPGSVADYAAHAEAIGMAIDDGTLACPYATAPSMVLTAAHVRQTKPGGTPHEHRRTLKHTFTKAGLVYDWPAAGTCPLYTPCPTSRQAALALVRALDECSASGGAKDEEMLVSSTKAPSPSPHLCLAPSALQKTVVTLAKRKETLRLI